MRKSFLTVVAAAALGVASAGAQAAAIFPDFQVTEGSVPGTVVNTFTADKITGNYTEVITFGAGTFTVSLLWNAGEYATNDGTTIVTPTQLNGIAPTGYGLYAFYQSSGTFVTNGSVTTFTDTPGSGSLNVFIDPDENATFNTPANGSIAFTANNTADDYRIAFGTPQGGTGTLDPSLPTCGGGINCGSFGTTTTFFLTNEGSTYFTLPIPFYSLSFQSGQLNNFTPTGTQQINGSLDVVFQAVPEPATLTLLGIGLLGLGFGARRKQR